MNASAALSCSVDHPIGIQPVALCRFIDHNMRYRSYQLAVLNYRAAAHPLHYSSRFLQQHGIRYLKNHPFLCFFRLPVYLYDFY